MIFKSGFYWFCRFSLVLLLLTSCSQPLVKPLPDRGAMISGREAWSQLIEVKALKANGILSWRATDGKHGKYRVRLFLATPDRLKIQWLTPWGSVAGQILVSGKQFWLSNAREKQTWHGRSADIDRLLQKPGFSGNGGNFQSVATQFFRYWPLLFSSPAADDKIFSADISIEYLSTGVGDELSFAKSVISPAGDEMHFRLFDLKELSDNQLMPQAVEIISHSGQIGIKLRNYTLSSNLDAETFVYSLKNFNLHEYL